MIYLCRRRVVLLFFGLLVPRTAPKTEAAIIPACIPMERSGEGAAGVIPKENSEISRKIKTMPAPLIKAETRGLSDVRAQRMPHKRADRYKAHVASGRANRDGSAWAYAIAAERINKTAPVIRAAGKEKAQAYSAPRGLFFRDGFT